ncbi:MAG: hypothetical protein ACI9EB_000435 [Pseudomonas sp.]|jgi:hypothetical protein
MSMRKSLIGLYDSPQGIEKNDEGYKVIQMRPNAGDLVYPASGTQLVAGAAENFDVWMFDGLSPEECNERYSRLVLFLPCRLVSPEMGNGWGAEAYQYVANFIRHLKIPVVSAAESVFTASNDYRSDFHRCLPEYIVDYLRAVSEQSVSIGTRGEYTAQVIRNLGIDNVEVVGCPSLFVNGPELPLSLLAKKPFEMLREVAMGYSNNTLNSETLIAPMLQLAAERGYYFVEQHFSLLAKLLYWPQELKASDLEVGHHLYQGLEQVSRLLQQRRVRYFTNYQLWDEFCHGLDFMFGSRLHGGVMAINAGVPSYFISQDARVREVCELYRLPCVAESEVRDQGIDVRRFYEQTDYSAACAVYPQLYRNYLGFLRRNGIEPQVDDQQCWLPWTKPEPAPGVIDELHAQRSLYSNSKVALINTLLSGANAAQPLSDAQVANCTRVMSEAHALERFGLGLS